MSLLTVVQDVCTAVGTSVPTSVFSNIINNRTAQEMKSLANEMAQRIAYDTREWNALKKICTFTGDGVTTAFNLPADYKRMLITSEVYRSLTPVYPMRFIPDLNEWLNRRLRGYYDNRGEWIIINNQMNIAPTLGVGVTAKFAYITRNCINLSGVLPPALQVGDSFLSDNDTFALDERLLKLGMIWQWKALKGAPYAEDMGTYGDALVMAMGADSPAPRILGRTPVSVSATVAYPWQAPTPTVP
jgi:hypothetical protein